jgi:hypothetical protein
LATFSPVLGLKLNDPSDPFQLSDFIANWGILDASPGVYICTSTTRPSWGTAQAGRLIFMKDLKQTSYWTGSAWADLRDSVPAFAWGAVVNSWVNPGASAYFSICTFTTPRPCALAIIISGTYEYPNNFTQDAYQSVTFDGVRQEMGGFREQTRFTGNSGDSGGYAGNNVISLMMMPSITAGQHNIGLQLDVSSTYRTSVFLSGVKGMAFISLYSSGNSL